LFFFTHPEVVVSVITSVNSSIKDVVITGSGGVVVGTGAGTGVVVSFLQLWINPIEKLTFHSMP